MTRTADFLKPIITLAAERAGFKCSVPFCRKGTVGPGATPDASAKTGTACHIYSASENGPRGSGGLSREERQSIENAIWCCATHGRLIDTNHGGRYPAALLKHWKALHEAWIDNETVGFQTQLGWVHQLEIINSFLFEASTRLQLSKATLLRGETASGKSSICEWLAGISQARALQRWKGHNHDLKLEYFAPDSQALQLTINKGEVQRSLNGKKLLEGPKNLSIIYLPESHSRKFRREAESDDLSWLAKIFNTEPETIKSLCEDVRINGYPFCRHLEFREEHIKPNEKEDEPGRDGWFLYVAVGTKASSLELPLGSLAASEEIVVMVQIASALARVQSHHTPTLLILDAGSWNWDDTVYDDIAPHLADQPYQVVLAHAFQPMDFRKQDWADWDASEVKRGRDAGNNSIVPVSR